MKFIQLFIGIYLLMSVSNSFGQKTDAGNTKKNDDSNYEIELPYEPDAKENPNANPGAIGLASFTGKYVEGESFVQLEWVISKKLENFVVEHSVDGEDYKEIGRVENPIGFENSRYTFEAREFDAGINFYRLKQTLGNTSIYSEVKALRISEKNDAHVLNLIDDGNLKKIQLRVYEAQKVSVQLYDSEGHLVKELFNQKMDYNEIIFRSINKGDFKQGTYFVLIKGENFKQSKKIELP